MKRKVFVYGIVMVLAATSILTDLTISYGCGKTETVDFEDSIEVDTEIYNDNSKNVEDEAGIFNDGSLENGSLFGDLNDLSVINADDDIVTPTGVSLPETISVKKYEVCTVTPILDPINATTTFSWYSSNSDIVEVSSADLGYSGNITGVSEGQATVTVTTNNGYSASMLVSVNEIVEPMDFTMDNELKITKDENKYIDTYVIPKNATTLYKVTSDNPSVVSTFTGGGGLLITRNGQSQYYASSVGISGICAGTANITVETVNGIKKNCTVIVEEGESPETISIPESYEIKEGKDWDIPITISPASAKTTYRIDTENSKIARVRSEERR